MKRRDSQAASEPVLILVDGKFYAASTHVEDMIRRDLLRGTAESVGKNNGRSAAGAALRPNGAGGAGTSARGSGDSRKAMMPHLSRHPRDSRGLPARGDKRRAAPKTREVAAC